MKKVFASHRFETVGLYQSLLEDAGIATFLKNEHTSILDGTLPGDIILPELWVVEDDDYDRAVEILKPHHEGKAGEEV